ncbi:MAG: hypothetical protein OEY22_09955 [Candidatus Bathyarchaeota archaeon]|nr:hypothetical protein [Candidatus Bathyarchaeota archaeon]MDH5787121.1 hypothetical protein [Candidatus Bathyarchaeota archaeon]
MKLREKAKLTTLQELGENCLSWKQQLGAKEISLEGFCSEVSVPEEKKKGRWCNSLNLATYLREMERNS